ncbi:MAG TPA: adenylate/guanylate cyclase domain-containing protein [Candidatus Udaeobacter sp.]|nr:adenylate/guanylate cyclase domain-containing protein [Candidatus Udaeobacter sp.]
MSTEAATDPKLEIGHVLFMDIVGYSKSLIGEQSDLVRQLKEVVATSEHFRRAQAQNKLVTLPTGDGMALVFRDEAEAPAQCALEIAEALKSHPQLQLRMGIHSGPVNVLTDLNDRSNVAGAGINMAQRVMDCGDAGHILLSKRAAEDLESYARWRPYLHDLDECEVKHGVRISLVNLCGDNVGNPNIPEKLRRAKREGAAAARRGRRRILLAIAILAAALLAAGYWVTRHQIQQKQASESAAIPEKSIAVLPFENFSTNQENAFFADGIQDEILTNLAKLADLKVISRTSVEQYRDKTARNIREIARTLGVANVLEGSVQRVGNRVRVTAQLIDARTDNHLWAEHYDRELADVFGIQTQIAEVIAEQLRVRLSPAENAALRERPTTNLQAYDLYLRANELLFSVYVENTGAREKLGEALHLLEDATKLDAHFLLAYCRSAQTHLSFYWYGFDRTSARLSLADAAIQRALTLQPDSGWAHLARAWYFYQGLGDYDNARSELALAQRTLPNNADVFSLLGFIGRRGGRWNESTRNLERAVDLDPVNLGRLQQLSSSYHLLRRYADEAAINDRAFTLAPRDNGIRQVRAQLSLDARADSRDFHTTLEGILSENSGAAESIVDGLLICALCERNLPEAQQALVAIPATGVGLSNLQYPRAYAEALVARFLGSDQALAQTAFGTARAEQEKIALTQPDYAPALSVLGLIDAGLGRKDEAQREGQRACELLPVSKDALYGADLVVNLALIYAWTGDKDRAIAQLSKAVQIPGNLSYGLLKLHPEWDSLRGDPRFEKIVASLAPKS